MHKTCDSFGETDRYSGLNLPVSNKVENLITLDCVKISTLLNSLTQTNYDREVSTKCALYVFIVKGLI